MADYLGQGMGQFSKAMEGAQSQLYRAPSVSPIGKTSFAYPTKFTMEEVYGDVSKKANEAWTMKAPSLAQISAPETTTEPGTTAGMDMTSFLKNNPNWTTAKTAEGEDVWVPANPKAGDAYQDGIGNIWQYVDGKWTQSTKTDAATTAQAGANRIVFHIGAFSQVLKNMTTGKDLTQDEKNLVNGYLGGVQSRETVVATLTTALDAAKEQFKNTPHMIPVSGARGAGDMGFNPEYSRLKARVKTLTSAVQNAKDLETRKQEAIALGNKLGIDVDEAKLNDSAYVTNLKDQFTQAIETQKTQGIGTEAQLTYEQVIGEKSPMLSINDYMKRVGSGEVQLLNEAGIPDYETMMASNDIGERFVGQALKNATEAGVFKTDFMKEVQGTDENGNPVTTYELSDELNNIVDRYDEQLMPQQQRFMKDMKLQAVQRGISTSDVAFSEAAQGWIDESTAMTANNIADTMTKDFDASATAFSNSLGNAMTQFLGEESAKMFQEKWKSEYDMIRATYENQMQMIAEETAANRRAMFGNIFQGLLSGVATALLI